MSSTIRQRQQQSTYQKKSLVTLGIRISEIYASRQGEGRLTGQQSVFVRTSGCNLRCGFCDTPFTSWSPDGQLQSVESILHTVLEHDTKHVVITGGEPMLPQLIMELTQRLKEHDLHITIETAGTIDRDVRCDLMSISPKMSNSTPDQSRAGQWAQRHEQTRLRPEVVQGLIDRYDYQLKFVVDQQNDVDELVAYCERLEGIDPQKVLLMPQGIDEQDLMKKEAWLKPVCEQHGFVFCQRMHILWYGNQRGT